MPEKIHTSHTMKISAIQRGTPHILGCMKDRHVDAD